MDKIHCFYVIIFIHSKGNIVDQRGHPNRPWDPMALELVCECFSTVGIANRRGSAKVSSDDFGGFGLGFAVSILCGSTGSDWGWIQNGRHLRNEGFRWMSIQTILGSHGRKILWRSVGYAKNQSRRPRDPMARGWRSRSWEGLHSQRFRLPRFCNMLASSMFNPN